MKRAGCEHAVWSACRTLHLSKALLYGGTEYKDREEGFELGDCFSRSWRNERLWFGLFVLLKKVACSDTRYEEKVDGADDILSIWAESC